VSAPVKAKHSTPNTKKTPSTLGKPAVASKTTTPTGPMKEVKLASGVTIKVPKTEVEEAKKTGMVVLKNGMRVKIEKSEIEEAQKKEDSSVMTASGVPIKISRSGAITVEQRPGSKQPAKSNLATKVTPTLVKHDTAISKSAGHANLNGTPTPAAKKGRTPIGTVKKPVTTQPKTSGANVAPRKL
jgi:hypothetical protein